MAFVALVGAVDNVENSALPHRWMPMIRVAHIYAGSDCLGHFPACGENLKRFSYKGVCASRFHL